MSAKRVYKIQSILLQMFNTTKIRGHRVFEPSLKNEHTKKKPAAATFVVWLVTVVIFRCDRCLFVCDPRKLAG